MKAIRYILMTLYTLWFFLLLGVPIIIMFPLLLIFTISERTYHLFFMLARLWAAIIIYGMGFFPIIKREERMKKQSYMLVANHTSITDIMMMLLVSKVPFVFVGKQSLAKIPIFGFFYKRTCILVDRNNPRSRQAVFNAASKRLAAGTGICIFPEGGVPSDMDVVLDSFKDGAFRLAIEHQIPIVPVVLFDNKKRWPYVFTKGSPGLMRARTLEFVSTVGMNIQKDKVLLREEVRSLILARLEKGFK